MVLKGKNGSEYGWGRNEGNEGEEGEEGMVKEGGMKKDFQQREDKEREDREKEGRKNGICRPKNGRVWAPPRHLESLLVLYENNML